MAMNKYGSPGRIVQSGVGRKDGTILCLACNRFIINLQNLKDGNICPFCDNDVNEPIDNDILFEDRLSDEYDDVLKDDKCTTDGANDAFAFPC